MGDFGTCLCLCRWAVSGDVDFNFYFYSVGYIDPVHIIYDIKHNNFRGDITDVCLKHRHSLYFSWGAPQRLYT